MNHQNKTREQLLKELQELEREHSILKESYIKILNECKLAEDDQILNEGKYRELVENSPDAIAIYIEGRVAYVNKECLRLMKVKSSAELLGKPVLDFIHPDYKAMVIERMKKAAIDGTTLPLVEEKFIRPDATVVEVEVKSMPIQYENKTAVQLIIRDISERKRIEENLQNEHLLLRTVIDNIPDSIYTKDINCRKTLANSTELRYMGAKSEAEIIGKDDFDIYPKAMAEQFMADDRLVIQKGVPVLNREEFVLDENKEIRWLRTSKIPLYDKDNRVIGLVGIGHDITLRKQAEEALRESEQKYRALADNGFEGIIIIDFSGNILFANKSLIATFEHETLEEVVGKNVFQFIADKSKSQAYEDLVRVVQGEILDVAEYFGVTSKGNQILFESIGKIIEYNGNKADIISVRDVTAKKYIEEAFRESEQFLKETQQIAHLGTYTLDISTGIWSSSEILDEIFGIEPDFDKSVQGWVSIIHPECQQIMNDYFIQEVIGKRIRFDKKYQIVRQKDQSVRWVHGIGRLKLDENNQPKIMLGTIRDITDQVEAEKNLQEQNEEYAFLNEEYIRQNKNLIKAKEKAEESDRLKSAFLANMSHEIRTPMNGILGFAELLKEEGLSGDQQQEYLEIIETSGTRMLNIINDIVDISKIESGQMKVKLAETNVNEQLLFIYNFFKAEVEPKGLTLTLKNSLPTSETLIRTDREKLYAILTNLVKNAIKYTIKGSIEFGVNLVETRRALSLPNALSLQLEFYVKDSGIGIPKDRQEAIFERFIQADYADEMARQGAGLGLAITKAFVEMLGGKIRVESEEGTGSTFYFTLPYNPEQQTENLAQPVISKPDTEIQFKKLKILIAEDDEGSQKLISIAVGKYGNEIMKIKTGTDAVETCRNNPDIDLVLMDILMPGLNGYEATRQIREFNPGVVIIAQTAYALAGDREKALEAGCNDYIAKPIKRDQLQEMIQKHFKK